MTAIEAEQQDDARIRNSNQAIEFYRQKEIQAIRELANVRELLKRAREKHEELFLECETRAGQRRAAGLISNSVGYGD